MAENSNNSNDNGGSDDAILAMLEGNITKATLKAACYAFSDKIKAVASESRSSVTFRSIQKSRGRSMKSLWAVSSSLRPVSSSETWWCIFSTCATATGSKPTLAPVPHHTRVKSQQCA